MRLEVGEDFGGRCLGGEEAGRGVVLEWAEPAGQGADQADQHRAAQRDHILTVAFELLRERGMAALTMSAVASRAGISRPTLYHYFPDVDAIISAWVGREIHQSISAMVTDALAMADPLRRLEFLVSRQAALFESQDHRLSAEHLEPEAGTPAVRHEVAAQMAPLRQLLADTVRAAVGTGTSLGRRAGWARPHRRRARRCASECPSVRASVRPCVRASVHGPSRCVSGEVLPPSFDAPEVQGCSVRSPDGRTPPRPGRPRSPRRSAAAAGGRAPRALGP